MAARRLLFRWLFGFSTMLLSSVMAQDDEFEYFRCDACSATFFKVNATLVDRFGTRNTAAAPAFEFIELFESICETTFTKNGFGFKQHEAYETLQVQEKRRTYDQALPARARPGMSRAQQKEYWRQELEFQAKELAAAKEALRMAQGRASALGRKKGDSGKGCLGNGSSCQESGMFGGGSGGGSSRKPFGTGTSGSLFSDGKGTTPTQSTSSSSRLLPASASAAGGLGAAGTASTGWDNGGCCGGAGHKNGKASSKGCFSEVTDQVFIGDLLGAFTQEQMTTIFGAYRIVLKPKLLTPAASSGMRAAILEFSSVDQAKWIVENLSGDIPEGMDAPIKVRYIRNRMGTATTAAWGASPHGDNCKGNSFAASGYQSSNKLFIGDLVADVTEEEMSAVFGAYGNIAGSELLTPNSNGKRAAIIQYFSPQVGKYPDVFLSGARISASHVS